MLITDSMFWFTDTPENTNTHNTCQTLYRCFLSEGYAGYLTHCNTIGV